MDPLLRYYLNQAGRGKNNDIGPVYATPLVLQRGYGVGSFLSGIWRVVRPILWRPAKALGRETLRTGGDILTDIARSSPDQNPRDIVSKHVTATTQNLIDKLRGSGRKPKRSNRATTTQNLIAKLRGRSRKRMRSEKPLNIKLVKSIDLQKETSLLHRIHWHSGRHVCKYGVREFRVRYIRF